MKRILLPLLAALLLTLCGCGMGGSIDELYSLPQMADEYVELQKAIDAVLSGGAVYSAPVDGVHRQSVQLCDLNGDGEEEAVASPAGGAGEAEWGVGEAARTEGRGVASGGAREDAERRRAEARDSQDDQLR